MSMTEAHDSFATTFPQRPEVDFKLEAFAIPVADVERAKTFYAGLGWRLDADFKFDNGFQVVQFTPPGSGTSIQFGTRLTSAEPGSAQALYLVVSDILAARNVLAARGVKISEVFHPQAPGAQFEPEGSSRRLNGPAPGRASYRSYATFSDPDGNKWVLQEVTARLPGRVDADTKFTSAFDLAGALRRAATAHGEHEKRLGKKDPEGWPDWYAQYIFGEQTGRPLPT